MLPRKERKKKKILSVATPRPRSSTSCPSERSRIRPVKPVTHPRNSPLQACRPAQITPCLPQSTPPPSPRPQNKKKKSEKQQRGSFSGSVKPFWVGPSQGSSSYFYLLMRKTFFFFFLIMQLKVERTARHGSAGGSHFPARSPCLHTACVRACKHTFKNVYVGSGRRRASHTRLHKAQVFSVRPCFLGLYPEAFQEADIPFQRVPPLGAPRTPRTELTSSRPLRTAVYCSRTDAARGLGGKAGPALHVWLQLS